MSEDCSAGANIAPRLNLRRERSCIDDLMWRCDFPKSVVADDFSSELEQRGYEQRGKESPLALEVYFTSDEHRILFVPATGRLQLRIHYETPKPVREEAAQQVAEQLELVCVGIVSEPDAG